MSNKVPEELYSLMESAIRESCEKFIGEPYDPDDQSRIIQAQVQRFVEDKVPAEFYNDVQVMAEQRGDSMKVWAQSRKTGERIPWERLFPPTKETGFRVLGDE